MRIINFAAISALVIYVIYAVLVFNLLNLDLVPREVIGSFGDLFGAPNALFSGGAFIGLVITLHYQKHELKLQREELRAQRDEFTKMADVQKRSLEVEFAKVIPRFEVKTSINPNFIANLYNNFLPWLGASGTSHFQIAEDQYKAKQVILTFNNDSPPTSQFCLAAKFMLSRARLGPTRWTS